MCVLKMSKSVSHICNATSIIKRLFMIRVNRGPAAKTALALFFKEPKFIPCSQAKCRTKNNLDIVYIVASVILWHLCLAPLLPPPRAPWSPSVAGVDPHVYTCCCSPERGCGSSIDGTGQRTNQHRVHVEPKNILLFFFSATMMGCGDYQTAL